MTSQIAPITRPERPNLQTPAMHTLVSRITNGVEINGPGHSSISSLQAPTAAERALLADRRAHLVAGLEPSKSEDRVLRLAEQVLELFFAYPSVRMDESKAAGVARTYAAQLEHLPIWAVDAGICECQGRNNPFPPSAGELRSACEAKLRPFQDELVGLRRILDAKVYVGRPERAEGAAQRVRDVADSFKGRFHADGPALARERNPRLASKFDEARTQGRVE